MTDWSTVWKQTTVLFLVLAGGLALVLFAVKYKVQDLEKELSALNREVAYEHRAVHVLKAEFSHLVEAGRLRRLATEHLHMEPIQPDQLATFASLRDDAPDGDADAPDGGADAPGGNADAPDGDADDPSVQRRPLGLSPPVFSPVSMKERRP